MPDPLQQRLELITGLMQADQNDADVRREIIERTKQGVTVIRTAIMMHQHQIMSTVSVDGRIKELEAKIKELDNRNKSTHDDATRRLNLFQENCNQLSSKVDTAMQGIIAMQHSMGEMENKATTKSEGGFKKGIMDHKVIQNSSL